MLASGGLAHYHAAWGMIRGMELRMVAAVGRTLAGFGIGRIMLAVVVLIGSFGGSLWALDTFFPRGNARRPVLADMPPLNPATRTSTITAPIAVSLAAIRDVMEQQAPRNLAGKPDNPVSQLLGKADIGWTIARSPFAIQGRPEALTVSTTLNGTLRVTGQIANQAGTVGGALGNLISNDVGRGVQNIAGKTLDQRADLRGNVAVSARPIINTNWRIDPNLTAQIAMGDSALSIAGIKLNVANEVKPLLDRTVNEQIAALTARIRNDPVVETAARREWAKMCRSIPLGKATPGVPDLWLEVRPTRAIAAQPKVDAAALTLTIASCAESAANLLSAETNGLPVSSAILRAADSAKRGSAFSPVPTAVPPIASA